MDVFKRYQEKLTSPHEAVKVIQSGDWVDYGYCTGHPAALDKALARRMEAEPSLTDLKLRGSIALWRPEVTKLPDAAGRLSWNTWHTSAIERKLMREGFVYYNPVRYSELPRYYRENLRTNVAMFQVAPMDRHGYFNFGLSGSHLAALCESADILILEVNRNMPRCPGGSQTCVHIDQVDMVVEGENPPIAQNVPAKPSPVDEEIARLLLPEIASGSCLQLGIGGMPNAVGMLIAQSDLKDLGVHTEMYVDSFVDMAEAGKLTCARKRLDPGRQVFTFAMGSQRLYNYLDDNPAVMMAPVDYVNDIRVISAIDNFVSINSMVELDLFGQSASETAGRRHISGSGGQLDFVLGAYLSQGGKSFLCCPSTYTGADGSVRSRILPSIETNGIVTATRTCPHYLATEYGLINLKGLNTWQRAEAIISIAHPAFQDGLVASAESMGIWRRSNKR